MRYSTCVLVVAQQQSELTRRGDRERRGAIHLERHEPGNEIVISEYVGGHYSKGYAILRFDL